MQTQRRGKKKRRKKKSIQPSSYTKFECRLKEEAKKKNEKRNQFNLRGTPNLSADSKKRQKEEEKRNQFNLRATPNLSADSKKRQKKKKKKKEINSTFELHQI